MIFPRISICILALHLKVSQSQCYRNNENFNEQNLQLLLDFARWKSINGLVIFDETLENTNCIKNILSTYLSYLSRNSIFASFQFSVKFLYNIEPNIRKTVIVSFINSSRNNNSTYLLLDEASKLSLFKDNLSWLIITDDESKEELLNKLKITSLNLNSDLIIATKEDRLMSFSCNFVPKNESNKTEVNSQINLTSNSYTFLQIYKIRKEENASLMIHPLGLWNSLNQTDNLLPFIHSENRTNFQKFSLKFGKKNSTQIKISENIMEDDNNEEKLIEIANYLNQFFNASGEIIYFQKLGHKENDGEWTDLLRAVVNEEIDLGLDRIVKTPERYHDMIFSHKILTSMRSIYIKPQESNELRDIFLIPFGTRLICCVLATGAIFSAMMALIGKIVNKTTKNRQEKTNDDSFGEAITWCVGIFCMQGSVWTPKTYSGNIILITCLAFALVIFNSYSAFITSILSVEIANIRTVDDLLSSNYNIGYAKNSQDEIFLRSTNDTQLQQIYLRGYLHNTVNNVTQGLLKSIEGHYGFFASVNVARKELQIINRYKCDYDVMEISLRKTKNSVAFPMSKNSPYRRIINLGIIKMYETGVYKYIHSLIVPDLRKCNKFKIFRSANLPDLTSAFGILIFGVLVSLIILMMECLWVKKRKCYNGVIKKLSDKYHTRRAIPAASLK